MLLSIIRVAFVALWRNRLRTMLTTLGITIGIASVICTVSLGAGSAAVIREQLNQLGDNFVWIEAGSRVVAGARTAAGGGRPLSSRDMDAVLEGVPLVTACSPLVDNRVQAIRGQELEHDLPRRVAELSVDPPVDGDLGRELFRRECALQGQGHAHRPACAGEALR